MPNPLFPSPDLLLSWFTDLGNKEILKLRKQLLLAGQTIHRPCDDFGQGALLSLLSPALGKSSATAGAPTPPHCHSK